MCRDNGWRGESRCQSFIKFVTPTISPHSRTKVSLKNSCTAISRNTASARLSYFLRFVFGSIGKTCRPRHVVCSVVGRSHSSVIDDRFGGLLAFRVSAETEFYNRGHRMSKDVFILGGKRTPMGEYVGVLKDVSAIDLGAVAARGALQATGVQPDEID